MQPIRRRAFESKRRREAPAPKKRFDGVTLTTIITVSVPILYVIGRIYDAAYLGVYGVNNDLFVRETQDYLYFALLSIFQVTYSALTSSDWSRAIIWIFVIPIYVAFLSWLKTLRLGDKARIKVRDLIETRAAKIVGVLSTGLMVVGIWLLLGFLLVFLILLPIAVGLTAGQQVAQDEIEKDQGICDKKHQKILSQCTVVFANGIPQIKGRVIAATNTHIAVAKDGEVRVFERSDVTLAAQRDE